MNMNNDTIDVIQCLLSCPMTDSFECESTLQIFMIRFPNDNNYHHGDLVRFLFICSIVHLGPVHLLLSNLQMIDHYLSLPLRHFLICILAQELPPSLSFSFFPNTWNLRAKSHSNSSMWTWFHFPLSFQPYLIDSIAANGYIQSDPIWHYWTFELVLTRTWFIVVHARAIAQWLSLVVVLSVQWTHTYIHTYIH